MRIEEKGGGLQNSFYSIFELDILIMFYNERIYKNTLRSLICVPNNLYKTCIKSLYPLKVGRGVGVFKALVDASIKN